MDGDSGSTVRDFIPRAVPRDGTSTASSPDANADYAELQVTSNFSFLRGASHPHELAAMSQGLGHKTIGITDRNSVAGIVRMHIAAKKLGIRLIVGCWLDFRDFGSVLCYPPDRMAYGRLTRLLTAGKGRAPKGECWIDYADLVAYGEGQIIIALPQPVIDEAALRQDLIRLSGDFGNRLYLAANPLYRGGDARRLARLDRIASGLGIPLVATNDVLYHIPERRRLQDVLTCIREHCTIDEAGFRLEPNAERHLKPPDEMARLFRNHPQALSNGLAIAEMCRFNLDELRYEYPEEISPDGEDPQDRLVRLVWQGAAKCYPTGVPENYREQIQRELDLIGKRDYAPFFLTVEDIVRVAKSKDILCQGRGSAANSMVCYVLGITGIDPERCNMLFERFLSEARNEPPDIDVDFEHERREEVIQYVYERFGRHRAGLAATVICYRSKGAIREVCKALGLSTDIVTAITKSLWPWSFDAVDEALINEIGLDPTDQRLRMALALAGELMGFPRHLSQHPGGFVITRGRLDELVPIENAAMKDRTLICWDKDDIDALQMLKVDVLALGMLTCISKAFQLLKQHYGEVLTLATVPSEKKEVYDMLSRAESIGVFQVESRAQQTMLPRLKPKEFYDLVIEVAIVRPGPIQGDMVHPYLRRRNELEEITYPKKELEKVLSKTKGVPLFQEQCMKLAVVAAKFSPTEADELRRAMATFKNVGTIHTFHEKFVRQMVENEYEPEFAERCFSQIQGFGTYGFPESHAASFALLVYVSAWIKCFHPDVFCAAILNSQPMGFYAPAQLIRDARNNHVEVLPIDINHSQYDHILEPHTGERFAVRLGFRLLKGMSKKTAEPIVDNRGDGYRSLADFLRRGGIDKGTVRRLAEADAMRSLKLDRRETLWVMGSLDEETLPLFAAAPVTTKTHVPAALPKISDSTSVAEDYAAVRLSLRNHPFAFLRPRLQQWRMVTAKSLETIRPGKQVSLAGLVLFRQRPGTAKGTIFVTIEDETGTANLIIWSHVTERFRRVVYGARVMSCTGILQREEGVIHVVAETLGDRTDWLRHLYEEDDTASPSPQNHMRLQSRDFR